MNKRKTIINIIIVSIVGTLLHFVYEWSGNNSLVGIFGAVNESTWEHLKLLFWPVSILTFIEFFIWRKENPGFLMSRFCAMLIGMFFIVTAFYTFTGIVGKPVDAFNISLYFVAVILTFFLSRLFEKNKIFAKQRTNLYAIIGFIVVAILFIVFTKNPPSIGLFKKP